MLRQAAPSRQDNEEWQAEKSLWGIEELDDDEPHQETISIWQENWEAIAWWLSIPSFLKWNMNRCLGMDVLAVQADAQMSQRDIHPGDYQKLKTIARTIAEEFNGREQ